jgi:hypothetical protein
MIDPDQLYTVDEVASILRCSRTNAYDLLSTGQLARTPIGAGKKGMRVRGKDITAFLDHRREGGPPPTSIALKHLKGRRIGP